MPTLRARRIGGGFRYLRISPGGDAPDVLFGRSLWRPLIHVSNTVFGRPTDDIWEARLSDGFFSELDSFCLLLDGNGRPIGWTGVRARTIDRRRCVYFSSTGIAPALQGHRLIPAVQRRLFLAEIMRHPLQPGAMVVRTRSPVAYRMFIRTFGARCVIPNVGGRVGEDDQPFLAHLAEWLEETSFDPETAEIKNAYSDRGTVYGPDRAPRTNDPLIDSLFDRLAPTSALLVAGRTSALALLTRINRRAHQPQSRRSLRRRGGAEPMPPTGTKRCSRLRSRGRA